MTVYAICKWPYMPYALAIAALPQWVEHRSENWKVAGLILSQDTSWVVGQVPRCGGVRGTQLILLSHTDVSLPLFLPPFPSL